MLLVSNSHLEKTRYIEVGSFKKESVVVNDTDQVNQDDQQLLPRQFTAVFEYLINVSGFELPFISACAQLFLYFLAPNPATFGANV